MSGGSKKQTVGYKVYLGMQAVLVHGPVDYLLKLLWDGREAWSGQSAGGSISINKPGLFGDEEREGGIVGTIDFEQGGPDQVENDYLQSQMGSAIPAFRGVAQLVMRQLYWGMNPYLKKFSAWLQRIHVTTDGEVQWYDEKAEINAAVASLNGPWLYKTIPYHSNPGYENLDPPTEWDGEHTLPATFSMWPYPTPVGWPTPGLSILWVKKKVYNVPAGLKVKLGADNGCVMFVNGEFVGASNRNNTPIGSNQNNPVTFTVPATGTYEIVMKAFTEDSTSSQSGNALTLSLEAIPGGGDMNPSHIIRECLTSPDWGMGYTDDDMDDEYFMSSADRLYSEGFGLSILWDRQMPIEDFVKLVLKHIGGLCDISYAGDNPTGKFRLKLIRDDYDVETLPVLGPSEIEKVEGHTYQAAGEFVNSVTVQYWDAATGKDASVTESDSALVAMQGSVVNTTVQYNGITNKELATRVALRDLLSLSTPLHSMTAYVPLEHLGTLETGDVFVMNWPEHKIEGVVMRIMKMHRGDGKNTTCRLILSQDIYGLPDTGSVTVPDSDWTDPVTPATALTTRVAIEAPYHELIQRASQSEVDAKLADNNALGYVIASAQREDSAINAQLWTDAGGGYTQKGIADFSPVLSLSADVGYVDTVWVVSDVADADLLEVGMYGMIDDEFVVVVVSDKTGTNLTVGRGVLDTVPSQHVAGAKIVFFDAFASIDETEYADGESVDVKLLPVTGAGPLDIASATADTVTMDSRAGRPYPPGNVKIDAVAYPTTVDGSFVVTWSHRNKESQADVIIDTTQGDVAAAPNTRYGLRFLDDTDTLLIERTDIGPGTATVELNYTGDVTMELYTIDDDFESLYRHRFTFAYTPPVGVVDHSITATAYTPVDDSTIIDGGDLDG